MTATGRASAASGSASTTAPAVPAPGSGSTRPKPAGAASSTARRAPTAAAASRPSTAVTASSSRPRAARTTCGSTAGVASPTTAGPVPSEGAGPAAFRIRSRSEVYRSRECRMDYPIALIDPRRSRRMPHPLIALVLSMTSTLGTAPSAEVSVRYELAGSPRAEQARKLLRDSDALKTKIKVPQPVKVVAKDCGSPEALWDHAERRITICYQLVDEVRRTMKGIAETEEVGSGAASARMDGALSVVFHHQLGHALTTLNGMRDSEGQADQFAALTLAADAPKRVVPAAEARHLLAGHTGVDHLSGPTESATFACLLYGSDPVKHAEIAKGGWVPAERAPSCADEYARVNTALGSMAVKAGG
ncbi:hypothetical protein E1267_20505 [Nonomuraea longispora]|uniref:Metallopeptidase n=2 Tax=Nonomuraea longispora TaxID=1848320 RepID=A0A4R4N8H5_9ACTN|nr:hypothetical protein E1267_20505 [Nonomuraea longispora]